MQKVRSENCFLKVCKINDLGLCEVMLKVRGLVVYTTCDRKLHVVEERCLHLTRSSKSGVLFTKI